MVACQPTPAATPAADFGKAPSFVLVDQTGAPFDTSALAGKVAVVDFIYTHCTDMCPLLSANMAQVQKQLQADGVLGTHVMLLSVSVDPLHDPPPALAEYGARFGANPASWKLLTGDWDDVFAVVADFKVGVRTPRPAADTPPPGGTELSHTARVVLIDRQGTIRAYLRGNEVSPEETIAAIRRLL